MRGWPTTICTSASSINSTGNTSREMSRPSHWITRAGGRRDPLTAPAQLDEELAGYVREAYAVGHQEPPAVPRA